ncbi:DMT family transporter [Clostridioides sp. ES-S-0145-01]|uniref:DMT family transporter n=1 Tax=Clostridioides sp. ES-S-0145-01 TaxID=2770784 RepID=UPI001D12F3AB|nr:DMT family transporter [Clostridioides sp. ES-S-0145-01]
MILCMFQPFLYFMLETFGVKYTSTSEVGVMISMIPIVTGIMGIIFLNEKMNLKQVVCIVIAVFGVIIVNLQNTGNQTSSMLGRIMILAAVICAGAYGVYVRKLSKSEFIPIEITAAMQLIGTISFTSILSNIAMVVSIFAGVFLLNEKFNFYSIVGSMLIIISVIGMIIYGKGKHEDLEIEYTN